MDAIIKLKINIIKDFDNYIRQLNIGHVKNYDYILHKISFIQTYTVLDKIEPIYEYLINN